MRNRHVDDALAGGLLVAVPLSLWGVTGLPTIGATVSTPHLVGIAVIAAWLAWGWCAIGVIVDVIHRVRSDDVSITASSGTLSRLGARLASLVLAIASLLAVLPTGPASSAAPSIVSTPSVKAGPSAAVVASPPTSATPTRWTVRSGDCLWSIAEQTEGDGEAWTLLAAANLGHVMSDGRLFTDPSLIYPGWVLEIPAAMRSTPATPDPSTTTSPTPPSSAAPLSEVPPAPHGVRQSPPTTTPSDFGASAVLAGSLLGVGAVFVGLLRRRRARLDRRHGIDEELVDLDALLEQSRVLPALSLTESAVMLAAEDEVVTAPGLLSVGGDGARFHVAGAQVWHAEPHELVDRPSGSTPPLMAIVPLGDLDGASWSLVVPAGSLATIGGERADALVTMALDIQSELAWGRGLHIAHDREELAELVSCHDGLLLSSDPLLRNDRLAVITTGETNCQVRVDDEGIELVDLDLRILMARPNPILSQLLEEHPTPPEAVSPTLAEDPPNRFPITNESPLVRMLAVEPRIDGLASPIDPKRSRRAVEVVGYIVLHDPDPITGDRIRTRVLGSSSQDAASKTLFNVTSAARRGLGLTPDGDPILPIADRTGCYRAGLVLSSDVAELHAHIQCARRASDPDGQMAHLRAALELIEGEPLGAVLTGWDWFTVEGHRARLETAIEDATVWLIDLALDAGLVDLAQLALDRARPALPLSEAVAAAAREVAAAQGSRVALRKRFEELGSLLDELDPGSWPVTAHERRFSELSNGLRAQASQASLAAMVAAPRSTSPSAPAAL